MPADIGSLLPEYDRMERHEVRGQPGLESILEADAWARRAAAEVVAVEGGGAT